MNNILRRGKEFGLPAAPVLDNADDFHNFYQAKVLKLRSDYRPLHDDQHGPIDW
jgi:hypothetical protein